MLNSLQSNRVPQSKMHTKGMGGRGMQCTADPGQASSLCTDRDRNVAKKKRIR